MYGNSNASLWRNLGTGTPPKFFRIILCFEALVYNWYFFRTAVLRKLFDIRFSYKHCNFSRLCLLVKMASKTVTRSIQYSPLIRFWARLKQPTSNNVNSNYKFCDNKRCLRQAKPSKHLWHSVYTSSIYLIHKFSAVFVERTKQQLEPNSTLMYCCCCCVCFVFL